jgi:eukaryotic-like serine/threonine-protein kinase
MRARNRSGVETPRDGVGQPQSAGWGDPHPPEWRGPFAASPGDSGLSATAPLGESDSQIVAALEGYLVALRAGQPSSREEFLAQHAEIAEALGECLPVLEFIETVAGGSAGSGESAAAVPAEPIAVPARLGDYRILREVGRGGMGVVYEAEQVSLGRRVALKILPFAAAIDPKQRQRFQIEAQAAAQLHHPHIVPIFGVGCDQGIHYYAMQFVDGRSLAAIIHELIGNQRAPDGASGLSTTDDWVSTEEATGSSADRQEAGPDPAIPGETGAIDRGGDAGSQDVSASRIGSAGEGPSRAPMALGSVFQGRDFCRTVARLGVEASEALDHAHGLGILHRDIKPANLLIDRHGAVWITDFGLARFPSEFSLTGTGDMVGTLRYMSPEQALARRGVVDQRTDIYALGVTLYELLTLRPAFDGRDHHELLHQIATDEPVPPRRLNPAIPRDLETIVLKAMAKDLPHRSATAQELAADLRRFLADEPILARRPGMVERGLRWARRHRELVATAAAIMVVSLTISTALIWAQARQTRIQAGKTKEAAEKAVQARNDYYAYMIESYPLIDTSAMEGINQALGLAPGQAGPADPEGAFLQWLKILDQVSNLPPADRKSRIVIARAGTRLGYARAMLSTARATPDGRLEPTPLAQATEDYRRSIAQFEELLKASPGDAQLRRYLADALGVYGMGCCCRFALRNEEAESCYRRAIELRRELVRGPHSGGGDTGARADVSVEVDNFSRLLATVRILAGMREGAGRRAEAEDLFLQLNDDVVALAARFSGPDFQSLRSMLSELLRRNPSPATPDGRRRLVQNCQWALILDPENPFANNNLAWALGSTPEDPWFDPKRALELARKAVERTPHNGDFWNTLGVAAFRLRDWKTAAESFRKSNQFNGGTGIDCFFLAMTRWHEGKRDEARQWFDQAIAWIQRTKPGDPELRRFHVEAASLLGLPGPEPTTGTAGAPMAKARTETSRQKDIGPGGSGSARQKGAS